MLEELRGLVGFEDPEVALLRVFLGAGGCPKYREGFRV